MNRTRRAISGARQALDPRDDLRNRIDARVHAESVRRRARLLLRTRVLRDRLDVRGPRRDPARVHLRRRRLPLNRARRGVRLVRRWDRDGGGAGLRRKHHVLHGRRAAQRADERVAIALAHAAVGSEGHEVERATGLVDALHEDARQVFITVRAHACHRVAGDVRGVDGAPVRQRERVASCQSLAGKGFVSRIVTVVAPGAIAGLHQPSSARERLRRRGRSGLDEGLRLEPNEHREGEDDLRRFDLVVDRGKGAEVRDDRERIVVAQRFGERLVGHHGKERASVASDAFSHRAEDFSVRPIAEPRLLVGREILGANMAEPRHRKLLSGSETPFEVRLTRFFEINLGVAAHTERDVIGEVAAALDRLRRRGCFDIGGSLVARCQSIEPRRDTDHE